MLPRHARPLAITAASALALLLPASAASAHVRVHPDSTVSGGYAQLTFRVPDESPTAGTVTLVVTLPQDHPLTSVSTTPVPGWTASVTQATLPSPVDVGGATITKAPRTVTWTAERGTEIRPGEYQDFPISVGPLPPPGRLVLPATQTYSDGTVVRWSEVQEAGGSEPEHPAPSFTVTSADPDGMGGATSAPPSSVPTTDETSRWLGGAGLVAGLLALAGVATLLVRQSRGSLADGTRS
jgi:uncharacterized protein YcnI